MARKYKSNSWSNQTNTFSEEQPVAVEAVEPEMAIKVEVPTEEPQIEEIILPIEEVPEASEKKPIYKVLVTMPPLNKRIAPSLSSKVIDVIRRNEQFEIFNENNGWGQLEDGNWIMLTYTKII